jgi:hypothetical protein
MKYKSRFHLAATTRKKASRTMSPTGGLECLLPWFRRIVIWDDQGHLRDMCHVGQIMRNSVVVYKRKVS